MNECITAPVNEFCRISGLSRRTIYRLINEGKIRSVKVGKRRLIVIDSYREMIGEAPTHKSTTKPERGAEAQTEPKRPIRRRPMLGIV